jgi:hypothetical protein
VAAGTKPYSDMKGILYVASRRLCSQRVKARILRPLRYPFCGSTVLGRLVDGACVLPPP